MTQDTARLITRLQRRRALPTHRETTPSHGHWQSSSELAPLPFWSGLFPRPRVSLGVLAAATGVSSRVALAAGGLPSLDVHLIRRRAILHLTLAGGACGAEKHKSAAVNREARTPGTLPASALWSHPRWSQPLVLSPATPCPTSPSQSNLLLPFLRLLPWRQ